MTIRTVFARLLSLLLVVSLTFPATVWAQDDGAAKAAAYYDEAATAYQQGDYRKAAELLDLAFGAQPDLVYKYNRILALQALGEHELALTELNAMYTPMKADSQNRFEDIDDIKAQLEAAIAERKPVEEPTEEPPIEPPAVVEKPQPNYLAWGLIGGGVLVGSVGGLFLSGLLMPAQAGKCLKVFPYKNSDEGCGDITRDDAKATQIKQGIAGLSMVGVGLAATGVGVVLLLKPGKKAEAESTGLDSLRLAPYVIHQGAGATFQLRF